jgi:hypothetical protein
MDTPRGMLRRESYTCWACASKYQATFDAKDADPIAGSVPCPMCSARGRGNYLKDTADLFSGIPIVLALSCAALAGLADMDLMGAPWAAGLAATVCLVFAVETGRRAACDPNRELASNRREADRLVKAGNLELQIEGNPNRSDAPIAVAAGWKQLLIALPFVGGMICILPLAGFLSLPVALIAGPLLAILSFAALAYFTARLHGAESFTGSERIEAKSP